MGRAQILLFGDSITQQSFSVGGWGARLADRYQRRAHVLNLGYSGYNTRWALELLPLLFDVPDASSVRLVTIFFGANDASHMEHNPRQHVPLQEYKENLRKLVIHVCSKCLNAKVLLICPPPVCHAQRLVFQQNQYPNSATGILERTNENTGEYAAAAAALATEMGIQSIHLWQEMQSAAPGDDWHKFLSDGLHLSLEGNEFVANRLIAKIGDAFPELAVTPCEVTGGFGNSGSCCLGILEDAPWHDQIDFKNHKEVFKKTKPDAQEATRLEPDLTGN
mmetsp:Transcript_88849/g.176678  ORF Transcript_88849/g.176678 Transcript_88849/m.176678 type:complete len:278 (-) Transcript_88849:73-906(-)